MELDHVFIIILPNYFPEKMKWLAAAGRVRMPVFTEDFTAGTVWGQPSTFPHTWVCEAGEERLFPCVGSDQ